MRFFDLIYRRRAPREKRFILTAMIIGFIVVLVNFVIFPLWDHYQTYREELTTKSALLKRYQTLVNTTDKAREKLMQTRQMSSSISGVLLTGTTGDLASAELQGIIKNIASRAEITFSSIKPNKSTVKDGFQEISLTMPFNATIRQIQQFLFDVEQATQLLNIKQFQIRSQKKDKGLLSVELEIAAYIRENDASQEASKPKAENGSKAASETFDAP